MPYTYLTLAQLQSALLQRLQDTSASMTTPAEATIYITEALRVLNANTGIWNAELQFDFNPGDGWKSLNFTDSPRQRTITDTQLYTEMEYMLMEPPTGGVWTGTNQFNITNLSNAIQYRLNEALLLSGANTVNIVTLNSPTSAVTTLLPDTVLDLRRVRWIPAPPSTESPYALWREDVVSANAYGDQLSLEPGPPESWMITANTPLSFDCSCTPNVPGTWDLLAIESGVTLTPPTSTLIGLPDDWTWVIKYGALADALSNSPEAFDQLRAKYCEDRYYRGLKAMHELPWLVDASVASLPVDTPSFEEADAYAQNWELTWPASDPQIVVGGMDFVALAPFPTTSIVSSVLTVVGNAPISDPIQLSRDGVDAVLAYAQHIAMFKLGGRDFASTFPLYKQFEDYCRMVNGRYAQLGIFRPEMILEGNRSNDLDPRFAPEMKGAKRNG